MKNKQKQSQKVLYCVKKEDGGKNKRRKRKIGSVKAVANNAVSNINLHMNFYNVGSKVLPAGEHKRNSSEAKRSFKGPKLKRVNSKPIGLAARGVSAKRKEGEELKKKKKSKTGLKKTIKEKKKQRRLVGKKKDKEREKEKKESKKQERGNKWERIDSLLVKLKTKIQREDPEKLKVFKNIEKIIKHVKKKKKPEKEKKEKKSRSSRNKVSRTKKPKARLDTLYIDNNKSAKGEVTEENEGLDTKYLFLEHLNKKTIQNKVSNLETEDKQNFLMKTLELQSNNNYFFKPKINEIDEIDESEKKFNGDKTEEKNFSPKSKKSKPRSIASNKISARRPLEIWQTPSKNSLELLSNEIAFKLSKSQQLENFESLRSSSVLLKLSKQQLSMCSGERNNPPLYATRLRGMQFASISRSCQDLNNNLTFQDKIDGLMIDSIIKFRKRKNEKKEKKNCFKLVKSWHELNKEFDLTNKDEKSSNSNNRGYATVQENLSDLKYYSESKLRHRKRITKKENNEKSGFQNQKVEMDILEEFIFNEIFDDFMKDGLFFSQIGFSALSLIEGDKALEESVCVIPYTPKTNKPITEEKEVPETIQEETTNVDKFLVNEEEESIAAVETYKENPAREESVNSSSETIYAIRTHFNAINEYLFILIDFLKRKEKFSITNLINTDLLDPLKSELVLSKIKALYCFDERYYRSLEPIVLNMAQKDLVFDEIENEIIKSCDSFNNMEELIRVQRNFHRVVFDCLMESLLKIIVASLFNIKTDIDPSIVSYSAKETKLILSEERLIYSLYLAKNKVIEITGFLCGIIRDKEDSMIGEIKFVNDVTLNALREDRMMRMLICEILTTKKDWHDHQLAKTAVHLQLASDVEEFLVEDVLKDFLLGN